MNAVDIYIETGKVPCPKCGLNLVKSDFYETICRERIEDCRGTVITKDTLKTWAKEQGKSI